MVFKFFSSNHHHRHLLLLLTLLPNTQADTTNFTIFLTLCGHNQAPNIQTFDSNFATSILLVSNNISTSGFGTGVAGGVYTLGQCFTYLSSITCQLCYAESLVKLPFCLPATDSRIYLDGCFLRYSTHNISADAIDGLDTSLCSNSSVVSSNLTLFKENVNGLVTNLTSGAVGDEGYYKAGSTVALPGVMIYGVAQCWRSLNLSGCRDCLESAKESVVKCLPASDGKALNAGCFVRYSTLPFYLGSTTGSGGSSATRRRLGAVLGSVFGALIAVGIAIFGMRRRATNISTDVSDPDGSEEIIRVISESSLSFKYEVLRTATDNFSQIKKVGEGGFGSVYKGVLPDGREIAVKRLFYNTRQRLNQFFNEVALVSQVQHKNLVKLLGCSVEGPESLLIYEYLCNTSLDRFLFDSFRKNEMTWERRFDILVGTAEGLAYLHSSSEVRIIHRDIKASNILLDEKFRPKIADFGLARYFAEDQSHLSTGLAGTFGYIAPEYIVHGQLTEKADTYSYGILVLEIITGRRNQRTVSTEGHSLMSMIWQCFNSSTLIELLDPHLQGQCTEEEALKVFKVGLLCTQASPILRPPMWKVVEMLTNRSTDLPLPTHPPFINIKGSGVKSESSEASSKSHVSENQLSISLVQGR